MSKDEMMNIPITIELRGARNPKLAKMSVNQATSIPIKGPGIAPSDCSTILQRCSMSEWYCCRIS